MPTEAFNGTARRPNGLAVATATHLATASPIMLLLAVALLLPVWAHADSQPWTASPLDPAALTTALNTTTKGLDGLPSGDKATAASSARRAILERRQVLLQDLLASLQSSQNFSEQLQALDQSSSQASSQPASDSHAPAAAAEKATTEKRPPDADKSGPDSSLASTTFDPRDATAAGLEELRAQLEKAHSRVATLSESLRKNQQRTEKLPGLITAARDAIQESTKTASQIASESASGDAQELLILQQQNATLASVTAKTRLSTLQLEQKLLARQQPPLSTQLDDANAQLAPLEKTFERYTKALEQHQLEQEQQLAEEATRKQQQATQAKTPAAQFLAEREAELAGIQRDTAQLATASTQLANQILSLENSLKRDQADLTELSGMIAAVGTSGPANDMLRQIYGDIEHRRRELNEALSPETTRRIQQSITDVVTNQQQLSTLDRQWRKALADLPPEASSSAEFQQSSRELQGQIRSALHKKGDLLRGLSREGRKLQTLPAQRLQVLDELEDFVVKHVLWMQDARPLDAETFSTARSELFASARSNSLVNWWAHFDLSDSLHGLTEIFGHIYSGIIAAILLLVIPALLWWALQKSSHSSKSFFLNLIGTTVIPIYLLIVSAFVRPGSDQAYGALLNGKVLVLLAAILQVWLLSRVFFRPDGIAVRRFRMPTELAASLRRVLNLWAMGALLLLLPAHLLLAPPFEYSAVPRLLYTAMEILVLITLVALLRPKSPLMSALFSDRSRAQHSTSRHREQAHRFLQRHWGTISVLLSAFLLGILLLDILGFRYTASRLSMSVILTVIIIAALLAAYWVLVATLDRFMWNRLSSPADAPSAQVESDPKRLERQVKRGLRGLLTLAGAMLIAIAWNMGSGETLPLQGVQLYSVVAADGTRDYVTASDLVDFALILLLLGWLLRELKALFELLIFPHLRMDRGKRYALVTMTRYLVFVVGVIIALNILKVNLGNLGWLVAAMGVGLGFGLQEIFANFISGLILLIERPIRVGDLVTIGNVMGNVTHISFRATTVAAFDNEEILIPNKELITGQVTNWTLGNTITRIIIPIQVAYGTDVDKVSDILMEIARNDPKVIASPAPEALFMAHGDSGLDFELRVFLEDSARRLSTRDRLNRQINKAFAAHGIEIPYPQRDLHIRSMEWPDSARSQPPHTAPPAPPAPPAVSPTDPNARPGEDSA